MNSHLVILQGALVSLLCPETELNVTTKLTSPESTRHIKIFHFIRNDSSKNNLSKPFTMKCLLFEAGRPKLIHSELCDILSIPLTCSEGHPLPH